MPEGYEQGTRGVATVSQKTYENVLQFEKEIRDIRRSMEAMMNTTVSTGAIDLISTFDRSRDLNSTSTNSQEASQTFELEESLERAGELLLLANSHPRVATVDVPLDGKVIGALLSHSDPKVKNLVLGDLR